MAVKRARRKPADLVASPDPPAPDPPMVATAAPAILYPWIGADLQSLAVPLQEVQLDPKNARSHGGRSTASQIESLKSFGQVKPIVGNRRNRQIVAGNGLYIAVSELRKLDPSRWTHIAVAWGDYDAKQQARLALADNRTAELSSWDDAALAEISAAFDEADRGFFDALHLDELLLAAEEFEEPPAPEGNAGGGNTPAKAEKTDSERWGIYVECTGEDQQRTLLERLSAEGLDVKGLTL